MTRLGALLVATLAAAASAQPVVVPPGTPGSAASLSDDPACSGDVARLCPHKNGWQEQSDCLRGKLKELSSACRANHPAWSEPAAKPGGKTQDRTGSQIGDCASDAERLCTAAENQAGMRASCLRRHFWELSPGCSQSHADWRPEKLAPAPWAQLAPEWRAACAAEPGKAKAPCAESFGSEAALWRCVEKSWNALSDGCRGFARAHNPWPRNCGSDYAALCRGVEPPMSTECMLHHTSEMGDACRAFSGGFKPAGPAAKKKKPSARKASKR